MARRRSALRRGGGAGGLCLLHLGINLGRAYIGKGIASVNLLSLFDIDVGYAPWHLIGDSIFSGCNLAHNNVWLRSEKHLTNNNDGDDENDDDGKTYKGQAGVDGGKVIKRTINSDDITALKRAAENEYNLWCYDGYEGSLTGWLIPFCQPTDYIEIVDKSKLYKTGRYYVVATDTDFSASGGRRKITIGRKMG